MNISNNFPIFTIFLLILILSGDFIKDILPIKFRQLLDKNMYFKHLFAFLLIIFFVVLDSPVKNIKTIKIILESLYFYIFFVLLIKTDYIIFIILLLLLFILYLLYIKRVELDSDKNKENDIYIKKIEYMYLSLIIIVNILLIFGFLHNLYLTSRKYKNFTFLNFMLTNKYNK